MSGTVSNLSGCGSNQSLNVIIHDETQPLPLSTMGEKSKKEDVTGKNKNHGHGHSHVHEPAPVKEGLTTVAHCCVVIYVLLILYLCFKQPFEFFTWHPLLLSLGWTLLMSEGILILSKENIIRRKYKLSGFLKNRLHWVGLTIAAVFIAAGFLIITISKNQRNKNHYTTWHGLLGLIGVITFIPPCINGVMTLYGKDLRDYVNPRIVKLIHVVTGTLCFTCGGMSLILSVYTKWFARRTDDNNYIFLFALVIVVFPVVWIIQRPLIKSVRNISNLLSKRDKD